MRPFTQRYTVVAVDKETGDELREDIASEHSLTDALRAWEDTHPAYHVTLIRPSKDEQIESKQAHIVHR
jgi:hypothetical protein